MTTVPAQDQKRFATLQALAALREIRVDAIEGDDGRPALVVTRWHLTRECRSLDELAGLLRAMGVEEPTTGVAA